MTDAAHVAVHAAKYASGSSVPLTPPSPTPGPPSPPKHPTYCTQGAGKGKCKNVLYFVSDDMRSDWHAYGLPVVTPNLDKLAAKSLLFEHAYCQISVCAPSRMSFMMSRRPDTNEVWNFIDTNPLNESATPGHFRDHGYITLGLGKTFHQGSGAWNAEAYWSVDEKPYYPYESGSCPHGGEGGGHCMQKDDEIYDWHLRNQTIQYLEYATNESKASGRPFYIMAGFRKPHAPWQYPKRAWDLYDSGSIALPTHKTLPKNAPLISWSNQLSVTLENGTSFPYDAFDPGELSFIYRYILRESCSQFDSLPLTSLTISHRDPVPDWVMQDQRHAYYASVSYVDEHVGAILAALDASGTAQDTMVLFHADHGYHLGEHGEWEKKSNFDLVVRVPLQIYVPWISAGQGKKTAALVELVDVFPTVAALAGLPAPVGLDGVDRSALLSDPTGGHGAKAAFHQVRSSFLLVARFFCCCAHLFFSFAILLFALQYPACGCTYDPAAPRACYNQTRRACNNTPKNELQFMGYSMRSQTARYTAWFPFNHTSLKAEWTLPYAAELYAHVGDDSTEMDNFENENVAAAQPDLAAAMHAELLEFFQNDELRTRPGRRERVGSEIKRVADASDPFDNP